MASVTMAASLFGGALISPVASVQRRIVITNSAKANSTVKVSYENKQEAGTSNNSSNNNSNGRREIVFAAAAAALCSAAGVAMAEEPKRGSPEAKKEYNAVCVSNPTARICRN